MTTKAQKATDNTPAPVLYDARNGQTIGFTLERAGRTFSLSHTLKALTDERYFEYERQQEATDSKVRKSMEVTSGIYGPKHSLWFDLVESRDGYRHTGPDWKEKTHFADAVGVIGALLNVQLLDDSEVDAETGSDDNLFDEDALTPVYFRTLQSGVLMTLSHSFKTESQADRDAFLAIGTGQPMPNTLASSQRQTVGERLYSIGERLLADHSGYAEGSNVPAWHLVATTQAFLLRQMGRVGKSFQP